ncbi:MAG: ABC transporter permease [Candidatus Sumerlaeia bacterium]|nr:ABC transporter permease [Candidatus Sumerlaeia bacterium]
MQFAAFLAAAAAVGLWAVPQARTGFSILSVLVLVPLSGFLLGGVSGVLVSKCRLQPFIVTLAMMTSAYGAARLIAASSGSGYIHSLYDSQGNVPPGVDSLRVIDAAQLAGCLPSWTPRFLSRSLAEGTLRSILENLPVPGLFFLLCLGAGMFILNRLRFGRYLYAIGGNEETARLSGINVDGVKTAVYAISGMLSFLAGVLACAQYRQGKPDMGAMAELDAIAAVVIGGTSLMGGRGRMMGTLVGVLIFGYLTNILSLRGVSTDVQLFITGIIIVAAVLLQEGYIQRLTSRLRFYQRGK